MPLPRPVADSRAPFSPFDAPQVRIDYGSDPRGVVALVIDLHYEDGGRLEPVRLPLSALRQLPEAIDRALERYDREVGVR